MSGRYQAASPGYWRGAPPVAGGQGSMAGPQGTDTSVRGNGVWEPTVLSLVVLVLAEIAAYALLRYAFRTAHGG